MPPRAFSLAVRLWITALMALFGSAALLVVALRTIDQVKIRGPLYLDIVSYKDLLADILPPPAYLIESYLTCFELTKGDGQEKAELLKKLTTLESDYTERNVFWVKELKNPGLRQSMLNEATLPAQEFFTIVKRDFAPAVQTGDLEQARKVLYGPLTAAYRKHRTAIDKTVNLANQEVTVVEGTADSSLSGSMRMLLVSAIGINVMVLLLTYFSIRSIMKPMSTLTSYAKRVSSGDYDCTCEISATSEIGSLASVLSETVSKVKESLARASVSERMAQAEADNARESSAKAEQAKAKAETAKQEGMLQAATKLEQVVEVLGGASERLAAQIRQSTAGAHVQAEKAAEVATAMEEMHATVGEVAKSASHTAETSAQAQSKAQEGAQVVRHVIRGIESVQLTAMTLKEQMTDLGRQSQNIGQILNVISDIADQTNLLALNAAIEAARAGDAGRGFAVVADEVRKLAEKTMTATKQVGEAISGVQACTRANITKVEEAVSAITEATSLASESGQALQDIVSLVGKASEQVSSIATAAEQQSAASDEINRAVEEVNAISRESRSAMNDAADAVLELSRQAGDLRTLIGELKNDTASAAA